MFNYILSSSNHRVFFSHPSKNLIFLNLSLNKNLHFNSSNFGRGTIFQKFKRLKNIFYRSI